MNAGMVMSADDVASTKPCGGTPAPHRLIGCWQDSGGRRRTTCRAPVYGNVAVSTVRSGSFRPVLGIDVERNVDSELDIPVLPYPHLKATLTSWESRLDVVGASRHEVKENAP